METTIEVETYERYQEFLPELEVAVRLVLSRLVRAYKTPVKKGEAEGTVKTWLEQRTYEDDSSNASLRYHDRLREIIDEMFSETDVSYQNEAFLRRIKVECDNYGYEEWEIPKEVIAEETYSVRTALVNEIHFYVEFLNISELIVD